MKVNCFFLRGKIALRTLCLPAVLLVMVIVLFVPVVLLAAETPPLPEVKREGNRIIAGAGYLQDLGGIKLMHLKGSAWEMGVQHGLLVSSDPELADLKDFAARFDPGQQEHKGFAAVEWGFKDAYLKTKLYPSILRNIPEEYIEEMKGIAYGLSRGEELDFESIVMPNVFQELLLVYGCTSFAAFGARAEGGLIHARNLDYGGLQDLAKYGLVAIYEPERGYPFVTLLYPLHSGIMHGMNSRGISVSMNYSRVTAENMSIDGIPFTFLLRHIVQHAETLEEAIEIVKNSPRTVGLNILISDAKIPKAVVMEVAADKYAVREADETIYAANRFNSSLMRELQAPGWMSSALRERRLTEILNEKRVTLTPQTAVGILRDRFEPGSPAYRGFVFGINNPATIASLVFQPALGLAWVSVASDERTSADGTFSAVSLSRALDGKDPVCPELHIGPTEEDEYFTSWQKVRQATTLYGQGRLTESLHILKRLAAVYPDSEEVLRLLGAIHALRGNLDLAERYLSRLVHLPEVAEPHNLLEAWARLGVIYDHRGERERALQAYQKALSVPISDLGGQTDVFLRVAKAGLARRLYYEATDNYWSITDGKSRWERFLAPPEEKTIPQVLTASGIDGRIVSAIRFLGVHRTGKDLLERLIGIKRGDRYDASKLEKAKLQLQTLDSLESVRITVVPSGEDTVDIVVRIKEGFGFFIDPLKEVVCGLSDLLDHRLTVNYYNLAGRLMHFQGSLAWDESHLQRLSLQAPLGGITTAWSYHTHSISPIVKWGEHTGSSYTLRQKRTGLSLGTYLTSQAKLEAGLTYHDETVENLNSSTGLALDDNRYLNLWGKITLESPGSTNLLLYDWRISGRAGLLAELGGDARYPWATLDVRKLSSLGNGYVLAAKCLTGWEDPGTPFTHRFVLGGEETYAAYSPVLVGNRYLVTGLELRRYFLLGLYGAVFADFGNVWEGDDTWSFTDPVASLGAALRFQTPIGTTLQVQYAFSPVDEARHLYFGFAKNF